MGNYLDRVGCGHGGDYLIILIAIGKPNPLWVASFPRLGPELCKSRESELSIKQRVSKQGCEYSFFALDQLLQTLASVTPLSPRLPFVRHFITAAEMNVEQNESCVLCASQRQRSDSGY